MSRPGPRFARDGLLIILEVHLFRVRDVQAPSFFLCGPSLRVARGVYKCGEWEREMAIGMQMRDKGVR